MKPKRAQAVANIWFMLRQVARYTPGYMALMIVEGVVWGIIHAASSVIFVKMLFDRLEKGGPFFEIALISAGIALFSLLSEGFSQWYWQCYNSKARQKLHRRMQGDLCDKARRMDLGCYDDPAFYTQFVWAMQEADKRAVAVVEDLGKMINRVVALCTITGVLLTVSPAVTLLMLGAATVQTALRLYGIRVRFQRELELKPDQRESEYAGRVFYLAEYAKEIRMSGAGTLFKGKYTDALQRQKNTYKRYEKRLLAIEGAGALVLHLLETMGIFLLLLFELLVRQTISLGGFAATVNAIWKVNWHVSDLCERLLKFPEHSLYIQLYRSFLEYEPKIQGGETAIPKFEELRVENVSFSYPGVETECLRNITLCLHKGEKAALVGYNGAGKTTLIKLLMRLYDPDEGAIYFNGIDIREFPLEEYRRTIGAVFQDYCLFSATVAENVLADLDEGRQDQEILDALRDAGFEQRLSKMEQGIHTMLGREFDPQGVNLSGGEEQKIAISRIFVRQHPILILDEPSSSLDPISEYELNHTIANTVGQQAVLFISHRLSTTRMADHIYMLEQGSVVEEGTHEELMAMDGRYAYMFRIQAERYQETAPAG